MYKLKNLRLEEVLIFRVDNLIGISEAIYAAFPEAEAQNVLLIKFAPRKERKEAAGDSKSIFTAPAE